MRSTSTDAEIGRRVHLLMWEARLTGSEVAEAIGMDQSSLSKRLRGERHWYSGQVEAVARVLGTSVAYLFGETECQSAHHEPADPVSTGS